MSDSVVVNDREYVSSKRASQDTGYAQDYIGQLARGGYIDGERVGGLWYVSLDSLNKYKHNADAIKPIPPQHVQRPAEPESVVSFDGKDYVSAARAAKLTGYHQDYVGQLARKSAILSRQVGNRWYVEREALLAHKAEKDRMLASVQAESVGIQRSAPPTITTPAPQASETPYFSYIREDKQLMPSISPRISPVEPSLEKLSTNRIPIRTHSLQGSSVARVQVRPPASTASYHAYRAEQPRKRSKMAVRAILSLTVIIMLAFGITTIDKDALYAVVNPPTIDMSVMPASAAQAIDAVGRFIEGFVVDELLYQRSEL